MCAYLYTKLIPHANSYVIGEEDTQIPEHERLSRLASKLVNEGMRVCV